MKQIVLTIVAAVLVSFSTVYVYDKYVKGNESKTVFIEKDQGQAPAQHVAYMPPSQQLSMDFNQSAENALHAVVHIQTEFTRKSSVYDDFFSLEDFFYNGRARVYKASGSGVIISKRWLCGNQ